MPRFDLPGPSDARAGWARHVREAYNARHRSGMIRDSDRFYRGMARRIIQRLAPSRRGRALCLDAGCGGGYLLRELARAGACVLSGAGCGSGSGAFRALHGLEISDEALRTAKAEAPGSLLVLAQGERLPYGDLTFDAVACLGNLEHFMDPCAGARELARVCRAEGTVWVLLPNSYYSGDLWRVIRTGYGPDHHQVIDRFAAVNEWRDLLDSNGLRVEEIAPYNRFKWWKRLLPRNLAYHFLYRARPR